MKVGPPKVGSPIPKVRGAGSHMAVLWDKNLMRLAVLITVLAVLVALNGVRGEFQGLHRILLYGVPGCGNAHRVRRSRFASWPTTGRGRDAPGMPPAPALALAPPSA